MARRRKSSGGPTSSWIDTYADMVTLLMCFFVLLYASSSLDETKWQYIYQSFTSSGAYVNPFVTDENPNQSNATSTNGNTDTPPGQHQGGDSIGDDEAGLPTDFNQLFAYFQAQVSENELGNYVSLEQTTSRIFVRFNNTIMFDGDSAVLKEPGKQALNKLMPGIRAINKYIKSITVSGHTAKVLSAVNDWDLSAARASSVVKYMDFNTVVESAKYLVEGRSCYSPIADNDTDTGRAQNRRVELMIVREDVDTTDQAVIDDILKYDYKIDGTAVDPFNNSKPETSKPNDVVSQIVGDLDSQYENRPTSNSNNNSNNAGPIFDDSFGIIDGNASYIVPPTSDDGATAEVSE